MSNSDRQNGAPEADFLAEGDLIQTAELLAESLAATWPNTAFKPTEGMVRWHFKNILHPRRLDDENEIDLEEESSEHYDPSETADYIAIIMETMGRIKSPETKILLEQMAAKRASELLMEEFVPNPEVRKLETRQNTRARLVNALLPFGPLAEIIRADGSLERASREILNTTGHPQSDAFMVTATERIIKGRMESAISVFDAELAKLPKARPSQIEESLARKMSSRNIAVSRKFIREAIDEALEGKPKQSTQRVKAQRKPRRKGRIRKKSRGK